MYNYQGEKFLDKVYKDLHLSEIVMHTANKSDDKYQKIKKYMQRLEDVTKKACEHDKINLIKKYYYKKYVIKEQNVPESYFKKQEKIALDRGYGHVKYDEKTKKQEIEHLINEQKTSLDMWIDYLFSKDTDMYPTWFKYYVFQGMLKLGFFDKEKNSYTKRSESTVKPFIELNREALSIIYSELIKVLNKENIDDKKLNELINNGSFSKLYSYAVLKLDSVKDDGFKSNDGIWKKYNKESNPEILFNDINGKGTGWCTAGGIETARTHINGGDFHVYYTKDRERNYTKPRIAIRMNGNQIAEIRGISENQNIEANMEKVIDKKLEEFPDRDEYKKKVKDMEMLTYIYTKYQNKGELTKTDLRFLYEIDDKITGFGYARDPRIEELLQERNVRKDLTLVLDCKEKNISLTEEEALSGNIIYHYGSLWLNNLTNAEGLKFPDKIGGDLYLRSLTSAKGLELPDEIEGDLNLSSLISAEGLKLPDKIGGYLDLNYLTSVEDLKLPNEIGGYLDLSNLTSAKGLELPDEIEGDLILSSLTSAEGLKLPDEIGGSLWLEGLTSAKGLKLPDEIRDCLYLSGLTSAEGLKLPDKVGGVLDLNSLTNAEGLKLPNEIGGYLDLSGLTSAEGLKLPDKIEGDLYLSNLRSAKGLKLPSKIGGTLNLSNITSAEDLKLPDKVGESLYLNSLTSAKGLKFPDKVGGYLDLSGLTSAEGLKLPTEIGGTIYLTSVESLEGLDLSSSLISKIVLSDKIEKQLTDKKTL